MAQRIYKIKNNMENKTKPNKNRKLTQVLSKNSITIRYKNS